MTTVDPVPLSPTEEQAQILEQEGVYSQEEAGEFRHEVDDAGIDIDEVVKAETSVEDGPEVQIDVVGSEEEVDEKKVLKETEQGHGDYTRAPENSVQGGKGMILREG